MKSQFFGTLLKAVVLLWTALTIPNVFAHHSHANLDRANPQVFSGVITKYAWTMPHVYMKVEAPNSRGELVEYTIELQNPPGMVLKGWSPDYFTVGERITWQGAADRNANRYYTGMDWFEREDGVRMSNRFDDVAEPLPAEPSRSFAGLWRRGDAFENVYAPEPDWPYSALGRELADNFDERTNPQINCVDPGPPKFMMLPYPVRIERPDDQRILIYGELRSPEQHRVIWFDRDKASPGPSRMGHSVGWFEGEDLWVETTDFLADTWGTYSGMDSSDQKHLLERFRILDDGLNMSLLVTITDPVYLAEPVVIDYPMTRMVDRPFVNAPCTLESAKLFMEAGFQN